MSGKGGHPRRHHVATAGHVWTGQGRRSSEASCEHGRSASESLRTWPRHACTTDVERGTLFPCSLDQTLFRLRWISLRDHCYFFNCSSQFRATCVFCLQSASFRSFSLKLFGTAGSLLFCNSRCDMCELSMLIFFVVHCLSWKVDSLRIHPV